MANARTTSVRPPAPPAPRPGSGTPWIVVATVLVIVVIAAAVFFAIRSEQGSPGASSPAARVEHVHGLGVDPGDGALYAGTHYGLFRLPEGGGAAQVGDQMQDFMGFTVAGSGHYLASGHPGAGQDGPSSVGLIESTDGGRTWTTLSLPGEADFHALKARHGQVYGINAMSGAFMVTTDKKAWETRSELSAADFAVSPEDADVIIATTREGPVRSSDGGRSFQLVAGAPLLQLVAWADDGTIVGVAPDGAVHASTDKGGSWEQRGSIEAAPHALAVAAGNEVFAAVDGAILASADGGRSFTPRHTE
jgi:hypothetical protein